MRLLFASLVGLGAVVLVPALVQAQPPSISLPPRPRHVVGIYNVPTPPTRPSHSYFRPQVVRVLPGETVRWVSHSRFPHTVTGRAPFPSGTGPWSSGILRRGQHYDHRFVRLGTYHYYCRIHPSMRGEVIVHRLIRPLPSVPTPVPRPTPPIPSPGPLSPVTR